MELQLWRADAIVLFDWLMTVDFERIPIAHPAQKQALADLLTRLETDSDVPSVTPDDIDQAQTEVAKDMGW